MEQYFDQLLLAYPRSWDTVEVKISYFYNILRQEARRRCSINWCVTDTKVQRSGTSDRNYLVSFKYMYL
jgi:hypothetical protein